MGSKLIQFCHRRRRPRIFCLNEMPFEFHDLNEIVNKRFNSQFLFALHQYSFTISVDFYSRFEWSVRMALQNEMKTWHCLWAILLHFIFLSIRKKIFIYAVKIITYCTTITIRKMKRASKRLLFFFICCVRLSAA